MPKWKAKQLKLPPSMSTEDLQAICRRLLSGYLSGTARDLVEAVLDEGKELPGFREVCATYGEALP